MFLPIFQDLVKPQWRHVLETLKINGALPVSELSKRLEISYMAAKQHCEELKRAGYLDRTREPRTAVGRPEIFYSLAEKCEALFPQAGPEFTLEILEGLKTLFGDSAPEKALFHHFQRQAEKLLPQLASASTLTEKTTRLAELRTREGGVARCIEASGLALEELHNPLQMIFTHYTRAVAMEQRMIEELLGVRVSRQEIATGRNSQPRVIFQIRSAVAR